MSINRSDNKSTDNRDEQDRKNIRNIDEEVINKSIDESLLNAMLDQMARENWRSTLLQNNETPTIGGYSTSPF